MNDILTKFAGVYGGPLDADEKREVGEFSAKLLKAAAAGEGATVVEMLKEAASQVSDPDDYEALMGMLEHLEKEGAVGYRKALVYGLPAIAAGLSAVPALASLTQHLGRKKRIEQSRHQIQREHPMLREDVDFHRYFDTVKRFAPDVAADPLVAGNIMVEMHRLGPAAMTPTRINELLGLQGRMSEHRGTIPRQVADLGAGITSGIKTHSESAEILDRNPHTAKVERANRAMSALQRREELLGDQKVQDAMAKLKP